jgi:hypothetical protein
VKTFAAQVSAQVAQSEKKLEYIAKNAIQDVVQAAQTSQPSASRTGGTFIEGKIPVLSGDLRNSLISGGISGPESYALAIAGFEIGEELKFSWTAPHALRIELGFKGTDALGRTYNQAGRHFVSANADRFPTFVEARASEVA